MQNKTFLDQKALQYLVDPLMFQILKDLLPSLVAALVYMTAIMVLQTVLDKKQNQPNNASFLSSIYLIFYY